MIKQKTLEQMNLKYKHIQTPSGMVYIFDKSLPIPAGYRLLRLVEGKNLLTYLNSIMSEWSIVGF